MKLLNYCYTDHIFDTAPMVVQGGQHCLVLAACVRCATSSSRLPPPCGLVERLSHGGFSVDSFLYILFCSCSEPWIIPFLACLMNVNRFPLGFHIIYIMRYVYTIPRFHYYIHYKWVGAQGQYPFKLYFAVLFAVLIVLVHVLCTVLFAL